MSAGMPPPRRIIAHGLWLMGGAKMSKSLGNVARYQDYQQVFGLDGLRYFVMREMPLGQDANFSDEAILTRFNADLANDLGNLVSRATTMIHRYRGGRDAGRRRPRRRDALDRDLEAAIGGDHRRGEGELSGASGQPWRCRTRGTLVRQVNKYIVEREPWALAKDAANADVLDQTLYRGADALRVIAALVDPVMPDAAERIRGMLGVDRPSRGRRSGRARWLPARGWATSSRCSRRIEKTVEELRTMTTGNESAPAPRRRSAPAAGSCAAPPAPAPPRPPRHRQRPALRTGHRATASSRSTTS